MSNITDIEIKWRDRYAKEFEAENKLSITKTTTLIDNIGEEDISLYKLIDNIRRILPNINIENVFLVQEYDDYDSVCYSVVAKEPLSQEEAFAAEVEYNAKKEMFVQTRWDQTKKELVQSVKSLLILVLYNQ